MDREDHQTVIEILAERLLLYHLLEITVCSGKDPDIHFYRLSSADPLKFLFLQDAQKFYLHIEGQFSYLVEEDRSGVRQFEQTHFSIFVSSRECTFFISK